MALGVRQGRGKADTCSSPSPQVARETASKFGCIVIDPETQQARHYVEKPESFISETINGGAISLSCSPERD
jgi:NDP-sugar pyrophosphorylase family protein